MDLYLLYIHISSYMRGAHICWTNKVLKKETIIWLFTPKRFREVQQRKREETEAKVE